MHLFAGDWQLDPVNPTEDSPRSRTLLTDGSDASTRVADETIQFEQFIINGVDAHRHLCGETLTLARQTLPRSRRDVE
jgi:hypothetical protein